MHALHARNKGAKIKTMSTFPHFFRGKYSERSYLRLKQSPSAKTDMCGQRPASSCRDSSAVRQFRACFARRK